MKRRSKTRIDPNRDPLLAARVKGTCKDLGISVAELGRRLGWGSRHSAIWSVLRGDVDRGGKSGGVRVYLLRRFCELGQDFDADKAREEWEQTTNNTG